MPRYYFNGDDLRDETGEEFADVNAARQAAVRGISELIAEQIVRGRMVDLSHHLEIEDHERRPVETIKFRDLFCETGLSPT